VYIARRYLLVIADNRWYLQDLLILEQDRGRAAAPHFRLQSSRRHYLAGVQEWPLRRPFIHP